MRQRLKTYQVIFFISKGDALKFLEVEENIAINSRASITSYLVHLLIELEYKCYLHASEWNALVLTGTFTLNDCHH